jgi:hypothetical protein
MLELWQKEKYSVKDFVTIVLFQSCSGRLDYETRVEYGTSWYSRSGFSIRRKKYNCNRILSIWLLSEAVKVGVTRKTQVPTRWIDQGANQAISIVEVPNRYLAGITEVALKTIMQIKPTGVNANK